MQNYVYDAQHQQRVPGCGTGWSGLSRLPLCGERVEPDARQYEQELRRLKESVALRDIECRDQAAKVQTLEFQLQSSKANEENITR